MKTNAMRLLDSAKIKYDVVEYDIPIEEFNGNRVSEIIGMDKKSCYKTLGLKNNHDVYICVVSVDKEIDLKKCAKELNVKSLEMIHVKDLLKEVGYTRGSVSPVGVKKNSGIYFDKEVLNHDVIEISAGAYGMGLVVNRDELLKFLKAEVKDITKDGE